MTGIAVALTFHIFLFLSSSPGIYLPFLAPWGKRLVLLVLPHLWSNSFSSSCQYKQCLKQFNHFICIDVEVPLKFSFVISSTASGICLYLLVLHSKLYFLQRRQWSFLATLSCLFLYCFLLDLRIHSQCRWPVQFFLCIVCKVMILEPYQYHVWLSCFSKLALGQHILNTQFIILNHLFSTCNASLYLPFLSKIAPEEHSLAIPVIYHHFLW